MLLASCASNQGIAPEYRLTSSSTEVVTGASLLQRGRAHLDAGMDALAIESFRGEIRRNPDSADAYNGLAVAYGRIGRPDLAQRYFETALAKDPANFRIQANLARLNGLGTPDSQIAAYSPPLPIMAKKSDPVALTSAVEQDAIGQLLESLEAPIITVATLVETPRLTAAASDAAPEILGKRGILSARFVAAPMQMAAYTSPKGDDDLPWRQQPGRKPADPRPALPPVNLPTEPRNAGTRLERVSLGEVRLVTMTVPPELPVMPKSNFASFGDRLAIWLPQSIRVEQSNRVTTPGDNPLMLAAIERAQADQSFATLNADEAFKRREFAYLFFAADETVAAS